MDISVIIVSWNVKDLLQKCLESIFAHTRDISFEVIVVDNASTDGTAQWLEQLQDDGIRAILNGENKGFAAANNQGIREASGKYVLLLNPDTELMENSLKKVFNKMEGDESIGVLGCALLNPDGTPQPSVRRFPRVRDVLVILLKLHKLFPGLLDRYLAHDFDFTSPPPGPLLNKGGGIEVNQVMGAFFCIRGALVDALGPLDPGYFIWFEEVDFCRRARAAGCKVVYWPGTSIIHHGGQSFSQQMTLKKQWWFFKSAWRYFLKKRYANAMSISKLACWTVGVIIAVEALSFFSFLGPHQAGVWAFAITAIAAIILTVRSLEHGVMLVFGELAIGSFGRMLELSINGFDVSIRMVLWFVVMLVWLQKKGVRNRFSRKTIPDTFFQSPLFKPFLGLAVILGWGIVWGLVRGNPPGLVFSDVNNYLYFALLFPIYEVLSSSDALRRVGAVIIAGMTYVAAKTIILFYIFSHELFGLQDVLYDWSRASHLAEITNIDHTIILSRIFMQSQVWLVFGFFVMLGVLFMSLRGQRGGSGVPSLAMTVVLLVVSLAAIIASFSRSFWLSMAITFIALVVALFVIMGERLKTISRFIAITAGTGVLSLGLVVVAMQFPIPPSAASPDLIKNRAGKFTGEAAVSSRYAQIRPLLESIKNHPVLGSGFGTAVTYQSQDPRVLKNHPDGQYTTTAFELGWLDMWLEIGLLGVGAYLYLLWRILKSGWYSIRHSGAQARSAEAIESSHYLILGSLAGLIAVALTHGASPYLNHPLGIGIVMLVASVVDKKRDT